MKSSETIGSLAAALAKAQAVIENPTRNRAVEVRTRAGGRYSFSYATLDAILDTVRKPLTANGLWFTQTLEGGNGTSSLVTTLIHGSGEWIRSETPLIITEGGNQAFGSALTYARRYALTAILGLAADEDDDGNAAEGNSVEVVTGDATRMAARATRSKGTPRPPSPSITAPDRPGRIPLPVTASHDITDVWRAWVKVFVACLDRASGAHEIDEWVLENKVPLAALHQWNKKTYAYVLDAIDKRRLEHLPINGIVALPAPMCASPPGVKP